MKSPRDPLPADLSAEPDPADPPLAGATGPQAAQSAAQSAAGPEPVPVAAGAWIAGRVGWFRRAPKGQQATAAGVAAVAVVGLAAAVLALTGHSGPAPASAHRALFPAAAGNPAPASSTSPGSGPSAPGHPGSGAPRSVPGAVGSVPGAAASAPGAAPSGSAPTQPASGSAPTQPASGSPPSQPAPAAPPPSAASGGAGSGTSPGTPSTAPAVAPAPQAQITAGINPDGTLTPGVTLIVGFTVDNRGSGPAAQVTANVTLPAG